MTLSLYQTLEAIVLRASIKPYPSVSSRCDKELVTWNFEQVYPAPAKEASEHVCTR